MEYLDGLPIIDLEITLDLDDNSGVDAIAFVDKPATLTEWQLFNEEDFKFGEVRNEEKRLITAPVMLANTPIIRYHESIGKYYTRFKPEVIEKMMKKYFMSNKIHNINESHDGYKVVDDVYMIESYLVNDKVSSKLYPDAPEGTWIATFYVDSQEYWDEKVKNGEFTGVSLEGDFIKKTDEFKYATIESLLEQDLTEEELYNHIQEILK